MEEKSYYELQEEERLNPTPFVTSKGSNQKPKEKKVVTQASKSQQKRLAKLIEKKQKKANRQELIDKLTQSTYVVPDSQRALYRSSGDIGKSKLTTRESFKRALLEQRAGLVPSNPNIHLVREYSDATDSSDDDSLSSSPENDNELSSPIEIQSTPALSSATMNPTPSPASDAATEQKRKNRAAQRQRKKQRRREAKLLAPAEKTTPPLPTIQDASTPSVPPIASVSTITASSASPDVTDANAKAFYVNVLRDETIQQARLALPICNEEQVIMETIQSNLVTVLCGETGSGKSTQVPQFLYEAGYGHPDSKNTTGLIGITQPRRVAAMSLAHRVGTELGPQHGSFVAYQIRYDSSVQSDTRIKFMTDGVLLKEIAHDFLLRKYSIILLDEAHERNLNTDILIGLLSRILPLRADMARTKEDGIQAPLRLVIMSATLRIDDFTKNTRLFPTPPPVVRVEARQFPVTVHFNRITPMDDYVEAAYEKVCKIHSKLPAGGILVFLTGQSEIQSLCRRLRRRFPAASETAPATANAPKLSQSQRKKAAAAQKKTPSTLRADLIRDVLDGRESDLFEVLDEESTVDSAFGLPEDDDDDFPYDDMDASDHATGHEWAQYGSDESDRDDSDEWSESRCREPMTVLPLYSLLSPELQMRVFAAQNPSSRLCVIATNVAETSLTIPGIAYVVDAGRAKERHFDPITGIQQYAIGWISKASADQRAGRAGRTAAGHCYRLYSSAVYNDRFPLFSAPEILKMPLEGVVLQLKAMAMDHVTQFPFPTSPDRQALEKAETLLVQLQCLENGGGVSRSSAAKKITAMGKVASHFPLSPRFAKMLALGQQEGCLPYIIALVSGLSVGDPFIREARLEEAPLSKPEQEEEAEEEAKETAREKRLASYRRHQELAGTHPTSDLLKLLMVILKYDQAPNKSRFCTEYFVREKAMGEIRKLRHQLTAMVNSLQPDLQLTVDPYMAHPSELQCTFLRQMVLSGFVDQVARRKGESGRRYEIMSSQEDVVLHSTSCLYHSLPEWIVFGELIRGSQLCVKNITAIESQWLPNIASSMCHFGPVVEQPSPKYDEVQDKIVGFSEVTYGAKEWKLTTVEIPFPDGLDKYKWFAEALLEGRVISGFVEFRSWYVNKPSLMRKSWNLPKITNLLVALVNEKVDSRASLLAAWEKNPRYLREAVLEWLPADKGAALCREWPPKSTL